MKLNKILALLLLVMISTPTYAAKARNAAPPEQGGGSRFYLGAGLGRLSTDIPNLKAHAISGALMAGTTINKNLAIEVAYTNFGKLDLAPSTYLKGSNYSLNLVGKIPVTPAVSMFAKFGFGNSGVYVESAGTNGTTYTKAGLTIGLGIQGKLSQKFDLRIAYDNYKFTDGSINTYNADITSASLIYNF